MSEKRTNRRYRRVASKMRKAALKGDEAYKKADKKYGYNYAAAESAGITPDKTGHWPSRNPDTGEILKGRKHPTIYKTKRAERKLGYRIKRMGDTLYSLPKKDE